jgi:hypothetical protein
VLTKAKLAALNTRTAVITAGDQILYYAVRNDTGGIDEGGIRGGDGDNDNDISAPWETNDERVLLGTNNQVQETPAELFAANGNVGGQDVNISFTSPSITNEELVPVETDLEIAITPVIFENGVEVDVTGDLDTYNGYDDSGFPRINTRSFATQVRMAAGQEIVLGGLARTETTRATNKPPALGNLPILGFLFGQENSRRRESTVLVTLAIDQIVRFDGDQTGKTADEDSLLQQATGSAAVQGAQSTFTWVPGISD